MVLLSLSVIALSALALLLAAIGFHNARALPLVREVKLILPSTDPMSEPIDIVLMSDIHMGTAAMSQHRLQTIVSGVNRLAPDIVVMAGDFIDARGHKKGNRALAQLEPALASLRPRIGSIAVLGNHDHWSDADGVRRVLSRAGIALLENDARRIGSVTFGGVDDPYTKRDRVEDTVCAMRRFDGPRVFVAHSPDVAPRLPADIALLLSGHTHGGQIVLPIKGAILDVADPRYRCGVIADPDRTVIVSAGLGTSTLPLRFGAPPDIWRITLLPSPADDRP